VRIFIICTIQNFGRKTTKERSHLEDLGIVAGILKYILNRAGNCGLDSLRLEQGVVAGPYVHDNRHSGSRGGGEILE
jgi:hypothetical protein